MHDKDQSNIYIEHVPLLFGVLKLSNIGLPVILLIISKDATTDYLTACVAKGEYYKVGINVWICPQQSPAVNTFLIEVS